MARIPTINMQNEYRHMESSDSGMITSRKHVFILQVTVGIWRSIKCMCVCVCMLSVECWVLSLRARIDTNGDWWCRILLLCTWQFSIINLLVYHKQMLPRYDFYSQIMNVCIHNIGDIKYLEEKLTLENDNSVKITFCTKKNKFLDLKNILISVISMSFRVWIC